MECMTYMIWILIQHKNFTKVLRNVSHISKLNPLHPEFPGIIMSGETDKLI